MRKYRAILFTCILLTVTPVFGLFLFLRSMPMIVTDDDAVLFVYHEWVDVTDDLDLEQVVDILRNHYVRRTFNNPFPSLVVNESWGIRLQRNSNHLWLSLGVDNILYRDASDRILYAVNDADLLIEQLNSLLLPISSTNR